MKKVYFVRHGQTENNAVRKIGESTNSLSEKGRLQAQLVASRLEDVELDIIISSPYERAHQTAKTIQTAIKKEIIVSDLFREGKSPSEIEGLSFDDPKLIEIQTKIRALWGDKDHHFSDEEDFFDQQARVHQALHFLAERPESNILVASHGAFIRMIAWVVLLGEHLRPEMTLQMFRSVHFSNTGVTVFELNDEGKWILARLNDTIHLDPETESI